MEEKRSPHNHVKENEMRAKVLMYCKDVCPYCVMAERLLKTKGILEIEKIHVDMDENLLEQMIEKTQRRTVPQIFIGNRHVGGYDDLSNLDKAGELDTLLQKS